MAEENMQVELNLGVSLVGRTSPLCRALTEPQREMETEVNQADHQVESTVSWP